MSDSPAVNAGAKLWASGMAEVKRRGYGEDGIYFDHGGDCRDSARHKTCPGRWRGVVSLCFDADGKRIRKKVSGQTRTEVMDIFASEIFGPATVIHPVDSAEAAIDLANDTGYGLTGGVISRDLSAALDVAARVRSGIIHINDQGIGDEPMAPFGGVKNSGYGKFGGTAGIASFTEQRWVTIQHSGRPAYPF